MEIFVNEVEREIKADRLTHAQIVAMAYLWGGDAEVSVQFGKDWWTLEPGDAIATTPGMRVLVRLLADKTKGN